MTDRDDIKKPLDHLPPAEERDDDDIEAPAYPSTAEPAGTSEVSPETAAEPSEPARHGVPPAGG